MRLWLTMVAVVEEVALYELIGLWMNCLLSALIVLCLFHYVLDSLSFSVDQRFCLLRQLFLVQIPSFVR